MPDRFARGRARAGARLSPRRSPMTPTDRRARAWSRSAGSRSRPTAAARPRWDGFAPASLVVPEVSLARRARTGVADGQRRGRARRHASRSCSSARRAPTRASCASAPLPLLDPAPAGDYEVVSPMPPVALRGGGRARGASGSAPASSRRSCWRARSRCTRRSTHDPAAVLGVLREAFPSCYVFAVGRGDATFLAASPELLVRREGQRASTVALAGSTRRSADPAVDDHLGEQLLQQRQGPRGERDRGAPDRARAARRTSVWVTAAPEPVARPGRQHPAPRRADPRAAGRRRSARSSWPGCCIRRRRSAASRASSRSG